MDPMDVLGIDACGKHGWVGVGLTTDGTYAGSLVEARIDVLIERAGDVRAIGVDMGLGLLETGWRRADLEAKARLGVRRSSVFLVAPRAVWQEADYAAAAERCRELTGSGLSRQAWGLAPKLLEARACWLRDPERIHEVHPELSFQALAGGTPLSHAKKTWRGQHLRRALLAGAGIALPGELGEADRIPADDVLDAAAAAWSARRIALGTAERLPQTAERDTDGRVVEICW
jgi:predicted RNase H-like nuclease